MEILILNVIKKKCISDVFIGCWKVLLIFFLDDFESNKGMLKYKDEYFIIKIKYIWLFLFLNFVFFMLCKVYEVGRIGSCLGLWLVRSMVFVLILCYKLFVM